MKARHYLCGPPSPAARSFPPVFAVDHVLVSDDLLEAPFACDLAACHGACCVVGDAGAPLREDERAAMEAVYPVVASMLTDRARRAAATQGVWEETAPGVYNTVCVEDGGHSGQCVFVTYDRVAGAGRTALCAIEVAGRAGKTAIEKPISCHLYPIRVEHAGDYELLNYEQIDLCEGGRRCGTRARVELADFLAAPLTRAYGADWLGRFREILAARRDALGLPPGGITPLPPAVSADLPILGDPDSDTDATPGGATPC